jgi:chromosome segregation protein
MRHKLLENAQDSLTGVSRAVTAILNKKENDKNFSGVVGIVADILKVPKNYELAVTNALGGSLKNVIVQSDKDAKQCINYMKTNNLGRATFMPLNLIKPKRPLYNVSFNGIIGNAKELINFDEKYEIIIDFLLGRVLVATDMNAAVNYAKVSRDFSMIVTLDGQQVRPSGVMSGGSTLKGDVQLLSRNRQIKELAESISQLEEKAFNMTKKHEETSKKIDAVDEKLSIKNKEIFQYEKELGNEENVLKYIKIEKKKVLEQNEIYKMEFDEINDEIQKYTKKRDELANFLNRASNENTEKNSDLESIEKDLVRLSHRKEDLLKDLSSIKEELASLKQTKLNLSENLNRFEENLKNNMNKKEYIEINLKKLDDEKIEVNKQIEEFNKDLIIKKNTQKDIEKDIIKLKKDIKELENEFEIKDGIYKSKSSMLKQTISQIHKEEKKIVELETKMESLLDRITRKLEIEEHEIVMYKKVLDYSKVHEDIKFKKNRIGSLGTINLGAIEEYKTLNSRYTFLLDQKEDLENSVAKITKFINDIDEKCKNIFLGSFRQIEANFVYVFTKLFEGGEAKIKLIDENDVLNSGIDIIVQPPGKKLQSISLLSGGEKTMTAIALLFSVLMVKPPPFCILDEIEAALDDANVTRFITMLKEFVEQTQFLLITHNKETMKEMDVLYGITMDRGVSKIVSVKLENYKSESEELEDNHEVDEDIDELESLN